MSNKRLIENGEEIGLATVYRVLTQFEAAGLVEKHHFESNVSVFELNRGLITTTSWCTDCGHVEEFVDELIEDRQRAIACETRLRDQGPLADPLRRVRAARLSPPPRDLAG